MGSVVLAARIVLVAVFAVAAIGKLLDLPGSRAALVEFGVPAGVARVAGTVLPLVELSVAAALVAPASARAGSAAAVALLVAFIAAIAVALARGRAPDCHCFGTLHSAPAGSGALARNCALALLAGVVLFGGPGPSVAAWLNTHSGSAVVAVVGVIATGLLSAITLSLWADRRRLQAQLTEALARVQNATPGLAVGAPAPPFTLPNARGGVVSLEALRANGRPVVLVFVDPGCGPCQRVLADLGRWQSSLADAVTIAPISRGQLAANQALAAEHDLASLLLAQDAQAIDAYRIPGTPAAVVIASDATIARPPAVGADAIEALIRVTIAGPPSTRTPSGPGGQSAGDGAGHFTSDALAGGRRER